LKLTRRVAVGAVALMVLGVFPYCLAILEARAARKSALQAMLSEQKATQAQTAAEQHLYDSLLGEARATRLARRVGYRDNVFSLLKQAVRSTCLKTRSCGARRGCLAICGTDAGDVW
jgi:hypothetical protein